VLKLSIWPTEGRNEEFQDSSTISVNIKYKPAMLRSVEPSRKGAVVAEMGASCGNSRYPSEVLSILADRAPLNGE
jgi:hypothetical protein